MKDRNTFNDRVNALNLNVDALQEVRVHLPSGPHIIPNQEGKKASLQIYSAITTNDGYISVNEAKKGLSIFGDELRNEARINPGKHPNIDILENIVSSDSKLRVDVIRKNSEMTLPERIAEAIPYAINEFKTPFIIFDESGIRNTLKQIYNAFSWNPGFKEFFAVKACPNPYILKICKEERAGADCSSEPELILAGNVVGMDIMFTSNNTPLNEFIRANELEAIINFDDITHIPRFIDAIGKAPEIGCVRYNPGPERVGNSIIGNPAEAKYGMTKKQVFDAFKFLKEKGLRRFGLHTMIASNELNPEYHIETARMLFNLVLDVKKNLGIDIEFVNMGGGWGVNYKPEQKPINPDEIGQGVKEAYKQIVEKNGIAPIKIFMENGRFVTGPNGWLVTNVVNEKHIYKEYLGVDSSMADFMRPGVYGAYHHGIILGKENTPHDFVYDVVGSLCENSDKFAVNRALPKTKIGDTFVLCGAGAHGRAMGFNYNGKLRCKELLLRENRKVEMIRRAERATDYFSTLSFLGSKFF